MPVSHPLQVITPVGRAAFARIYRPEAINEGNEPKYGMTLLIPKDTPAEDLADLRKVIEGAKEKKWGSNPPRLRLPIHDGDALDAQGQKLFPYEGHEGHWVIKARSKDKPGLIDRSRAPIGNETDFYSGCYCRCVLQAHPYDGQRSKGVTFLLLHIQKYEDGEAFAGTKITAQEAFDDDMSTPAPAGDAFTPPAGGDDDLPF